MNSVIIGLVIVGIAFIGFAIFGKIRPDIVWKNRSKGNNPFLRFRFFSFPNNSEGDTVSPEQQKYGFIVFLLSGIMFLLEAIAFSIPQWQENIAAIAISIAMVMTIIMLFTMWKFVLSQNEGFRTISLVLCIIASVAMIVFCIYYWHITLA